MKKITIILLAALMLASCASYTPCHTYDGSYGPMPTRRIPRHRVFYQPLNVQTVKI